MFNLGVWVFDVQMYGFPSGCMGVYIGCMGLCTDVWIFPWCRGVYGGTGVKCGRHGSELFVSLTYPHSLWYK